VNLNHLAVFHAVAEEKSISKGAERLLVSQPAVSKQVGELERNIGTPLFDRLPRGVRLTAAGELLMGFARQIFGAVGQAERAMEELRGLSRGRLSVAAGTTIGVYLLPEIFVRFRQEYPGIQMHMEIANGEVIRNRLLEGAVDVGLTEVEIDDDRFESVAFMKDRLVAIAAPNHALAGKRSIKPAELCGYPFVIRETGSGTKSLVERALTERGLSVKAVMSLGSTEAIKRAVAAGVGVAIVSSLTVGLELQIGRLIKLPVSDLSIQRALNWIVLRDSHPSHAVRAFRKLLDETCKNMRG
jgi:DNA-binding transcriptional LysR family regulator